MKIGAEYSHFNGKEHLLTHKPSLWQEIEAVIAGVDAQQCRTKRSQEKTMPGKLLYSPRDMNSAFKQGFQQHGWQEHRTDFWTTSEEQLLRSIYEMPPENQKRAIESAGHTPIGSHNQIDFVKDRIAVEVQFGKYSFVAYDLFVKHMTFYTAGLIDVGMEIVPMKQLQNEMPSGISYYERDLLNLVRQGRGVPAVPLVLIGIEP